MMKKMTFILLLLAHVVLAQDTGKVWDLLLQNKRQEARKQFDKDFDRKKGSNIDLLVLDAFIDVENGRLEFDKSFLENISKFDESKYYLYPLWRNGFVIGGVAEDDFNELDYERMDFIASSPLYQNDPYVIISKALSERKRLNYEGFNEYVQKLNNINNWQFCGVFENMNGSGHDTEYEPEYYAKNDKMFNANSNGMVGWYVPEIKQNEGGHFYYNEQEYGSGIIYAQTFIENDIDREVVLDFAASGPLKIFLNDVEIYSNDKMEYAEINAYHLKFNLKKGINRFLLKSSISGRGDYFYTALKDTQGKAIPSLKYHESYKDYTQGSLSEINPTEVLPYFEKYLKEKIAQNPENPLYRIMLFQAYIYSFKNEQAYEAIEELYKKYPSSSMLNVLLIGYYNNIDDSQKAQELNQNIMLNDEDYYFSIISKFGDSDWLIKSNISEVEKYRDKAKGLYSTLYVDFYDYIILLRNSDIDAGLEKMDEILAKTHFDEGLITSFSPMYAQLKNDPKKTITIYEEFITKRENQEVTNTLINYYNRNGRSEDAKKLINSRIKHYPYYNNMYYDAITIANGENAYEESLKYSDACLKNFPYSFRFMEQKGMVYNYMKDTKLAEKYFKQALVHYSSNSSLRKTLYDITKTPDEIEEVTIKKPYDVIKERRGSKMQSNYGVVLLLDEYIVNVLPEGARKAKTKLAYEITSENGIEELKEYNVSGNSLNIIKAEIVKPDGSVVPGEQNYGTLVFTNLKVNDVIYIEYETTTNGYGRFYKDFTLTSYFNGGYPSLHTVFGIIYPKNVSFDYKMLNGDIPFTKKKLGDRTFIKWEMKDIPGMPLGEDYSEAYGDRVNQVRVSTIKSWGEIANWYADLVKKSLRDDNVANKTYAEIFPNGANGLTDDQKAYEIYKYIEENITYSSLDFRQSGYVPQKPSKTITTKLGDCKDVSTLFVYMAQKAGLKANLVLVKTNQSGIKNLVLPSIDFNHCIVKVSLEGKDHFLELTGKYIPFKGLPISLYKANALVISFDKTENEKAQLTSISFNNALTDKSESVTTIYVEDNKKTFKDVHNYTGNIKSYYNELFSDSSEDYRKKEIEEVIHNRIGKVMTLDSYKLINNERFKPSISFETNFSVSEKLQTVGSLKIMEIPFIDRVYTRNIISQEKRNYDIQYIDYENTKYYHNEVIINLPEGQKFVEVPEGKELSFKDHHYKVSYELVSPNSLKVTREVNMSWDNVTVSEYADYKKYVEEVIAIEEQIIGFK